MASPQELTGRELDEAAALAIGYKPVRPALCNYITHWKDALCVKHERCPEFGTDPALIDEMVAWLNACEGVCELLISANTDRSVARLLMVGFEDPLDLEGDTIQQALARLVVAVAEEVAS